MLATVSVGSVSSVSASATPPPQDSLEAPGEGYGARTSDKGTRPLGRSGAVVPARDTWRHARTRPHGNKALGYGGAHEASLACVQRAQGGEGLIQPPPVWS